MKRIRGYFYDFFLAFTEKRKNGMDADFFGGICSGDRRDLSFFRRARASERIFGCCRAGRSAVPGNQSERAAFIFAETAAGNGGFFGTAVCSGNCGGRHMSSARLVRDIGRSGIDSLFHALWNEGASFFSVLHFTTAAFSDSGISDADGLVFSQDGTEKNIDSSGGCHNRMLD